MTPRELLIDKILHSFELSELMDALGINEEELWDICLHRLGIIDMNVLINILTEE